MAGNRLSLFFNSSYPFSFGLGIDDLGIFPVLLAEGNCWAKLVYGLEDWIPIGPVLFTDGLIVKNSTLSRTLFEFWAVWQFVKEDDALFGTVFPESVGWLILSASAYHRKNFLIVLYFIQFKKQSIVCPSIFKASAVLMTSNRKTIESIPDIFDMDVEEAFLCWNIQVEF